MKHSEDWPCRESCGVWVVIPDGRTRRAAFVRIHMDDGGSVPVKAVAELRRRLGSHETAPTPPVLRSVKKSRSAT